MRKRASCVLGNQCSHMSQSIAKTGQWGLLLKRIFSSFASRQTTCVREALSADGPLTKLYVMSVYMQNINGKNYLWP